MTNTSPSKRRIIAAFGGVIGVLIAIVLANIYSLSIVAGNLNRIVDTHNVQMRIMQEILDLARQRSLTLQHMLLAEDPFLIDDQVVKMSAIGLRYLELRDEMVAHPLTGKEQKLLEKQYSQTAITGRIQSRVIGLMTDDDFDAAKQLFYRQAIPSQSKAMALMHEFVALQDSHNRHELVQTTDVIESQRNRMLMLLVVGLILSLLIAFWVTRRIQHEIDRRNRIEAELETRVEERTQQLEQLAREDHVTALPNRSAFTKELTSALATARRDGSKVALFFMDLDGFKKVNDTHGHGVGDRALVEIAQRLSKATDGRGLLSRVGGDEFTLIIRDVKGDTEVKAIAEEIIDVINQPLIIDGQYCNIGISIGCAISNGVSISFDDFLTHADDAMYSAKRAGKNRLVVA